MLYESTLENPLWQNELTNVIASALREGPIRVYVKLYAAGGRLARSHVVVERIPWTDEYSTAHVRYAYELRPDGEELELDMLLSNRALDVDTARAAREIVATIAKLVSDALSETTIPNAAVAFNTLISMLYSVYGVLAADADYEARIENLGSSNGVRSHIEIRYHP